MTLTMQEAVALAAVVDAAQRNARVGYLADNGDVVTGTVRSIGDERGNFLRNDEDIRHGYVRITLSSGFELFRPIGEVTAGIRETTFVIDYES